MYLIIAKNTKFGDWLYDVFLEKDFDTAYRGLQNCTKDLKQEIDSYSGMGLKKTELDEHTDRDTGITYITIGNRYEPADAQIQMIPVSRQTGYVVCCDCPDTAFFKLVPHVYQSGETGWKGFQELITKLQNAGWVCVDEASHIYQCFNERTGEDERLRLSMLKF